MSREGIDSGKGKEGKVSLEEEDKEDTDKNLSLARLAVAGKIFINHDKNI